MTRKFLYPVLLFLVGLRTEVWAQSESEDALKPHWASLPLAQADYLPPGSSWLQFPDEIVGDIFVAERDESGSWAVKHDGDRFYNARSIGQCYLGAAKGKVAVPNNVPLLLDVGDTTDLQFLDNLEKGTFVAIEAVESEGTIENLRSLLESGAQYIRFPGVENDAVDRVHTLKPSNALRRVSAMRFGTVMFGGPPTVLGRVLAKCPKLRSVELTWHIENQWMKAPYLESLDVPVFLGRHDWFERARKQLKVIASLPALKTVTFRVRGEAGDRRDQALRLISQNADVDSMTVNLEGKATLADLRELSQARDLNVLSCRGFTTEAVSVLKDLPIESLQIGTVRDVSLASPLLQMKSLRDFPKLAVEAEALTPLRQRQNIRTLDLVAKKDAANPIYAQIIDANPQLEHLSLEGILPTDELLQAIRKCDRLKTLRLHLVAFPTPAVKYPSQRSLESADQVQAAFPELLELDVWCDGLLPFRLSAPKLQKVKVQCGMYWPDSEFLDNCPSITDLNWGFLPVPKNESQALIGKLAELPGLSSVGSLDFVVDRNGIRALSRLTKITKIDIKGHFKPEDLLPLRKCGSLHYLNVRSPGWSDAEVKHLIEIFSPVRLIYHRTYLGE